MGEPQGRFGDTYVFKWEVATETAFFQNFVLQAVAKDNDGNVVRFGTLAGMIADNSANTRPVVLVDNVTVDNEGVNIRALAEINDNTFFGGICGVNSSTESHWTLLEGREASLRRVCRNM